jgi:hypothetical protein
LYNIKKSALNLFSPDYIKNKFKSEKKTKISDPIFLGMATQLGPRILGLVASQNQEGSNSVGSCCPIA